MATAERRFDRSTNRAGRRVGDPSFVTGDQGVFLEYAKFERLTDRGSARPRDDLDGTGWILAGDEFWPVEAHGSDDISRDAQPWRRTLEANVAANLLRNVWAYVVICCGHFADGAEKFTPAALEGETKPQWYLRQMLGSANFNAGPVMAFLSGNLCYQIEHHLYPDLPSNRYAEIAQRVRAVCATYDLPYTTGPLARQYLLTLRTVCKLALPDRFLSATSDDAPETASEDKFRNVEALHLPGGSDDNARRRGLSSAILDRKNGRAAS